MEYLAFEEEYHRSVILLSYIKKHDTWDSKTLSGFGSVGNLTMLDADDALQLYDDFYKYAKKVLLYKSLLISRAVFLLRPASPLWRLIPSFA